MIQFRSTSLLTLFLLIACSSASDQSTPAAGAGGSSGGNAGQGDSSGEGGKVVESEGGAPADGGAAGEGDGGSSDAGQGGSSIAGQGGEAGAEVGAGGVGGAFEDPDDCTLPDYLKAMHLMVRTKGAPEVTNFVPTSNITGTVPFGTIVKYSNASKFSAWRCAHSPFCSYAVRVPALSPMPETERYWEPVYWQGTPPDGTVGEWVGACSLGSWDYHGTCGGFYLGGDLVNYQSSTDLYAERFVWQCRIGWEAVCDVQEPGTGYAWENVSSSFQCYGFTTP